jgi:hypothetical protein
MIALRCRHGAGGTTGEARDEDDVRSVRFIHRRFPRELTYLTRICMFGAPGGITTAATSPAALAAGTTSFVVTAVATGGRIHEAAHTAEVAVVITADGMMTVEVVGTSDVVVASRVVAACSAVATVATGGAIVTRGPGLGGRAVGSSAWSTCRSPATGSVRRAAPCASRRAKSASSAARRAEEAARRVSAGLYCAACASMKLVTVHLHVSLDL